jgi:hypothetical protein
MFGDKVFQAMVFGRHMQEASIALKILGWSGVSNTPKIPWYLANYSIQNRVFYMLAKHSLEKIPLYSSIPCFCLKTLKILCFQIPPPPQHFSC